ncbi:MAG: hypothetical protein P8182_09395 [Deltaproteobacteria bacterium]
MGRPSSTFQGNLLDFSPKIGDYYTSHNLTSKGSIAQMNQARNPFFRMLALAIAVCACFGLMGAAPASAQFFSGLTNYFSPLVYIPPVQGEFKVRPIVVSISSGSFSVPRLGRSWDLRDDFGLNSTGLFIDLMGRLQVGMVSARVNLDVRDFSGSARDPFVPGGESADAQFEYAGFRLGVDLDPLQWGRSRIGANLDYYLYQPRFIEAGIINTLSGTDISSGSTPLTLGFHVVFVPPGGWNGVTGIFEARASWSVLGTSTRDWEVSGGVKFPETVLGAVGLKAGYRYTWLEFDDEEFIYQRQELAKFDIGFSGWFGELVYFY